MFWENMMFWKKKAENPHPHIKYTKYGEPYLDAEKFYKSDLAKKLEKKREEIGKIVKNTSAHAGKKQRGENP